VLEIGLTGDFGEAAAVELQAEERVGRHPLMLELENALDVLEVQAAVVANRLPDQAPRIVRAAARQMLGDHVDRLLRSAHRVVAAAFVAPQLDFLADDLLHAGDVEQGELEACGHAHQFRGQIEPRAHEYQRARRLRVRQRDFANQPQIDGILQIGLRVEQHVDAVLNGAIDVAQGERQIARLRDGFRAHAPPQPARDRPGI
jgi:hypothetical protein